MLIKQERFVLRDYQKEAVDRGINSIKSGIRGLIVLPTGSGKSLVIANIVKGIEGKTIVFQPSKEILEQNYGKYATYSDDDDHSIYSASLKSKMLSKVVFATIGSVINSMSKFQDYDNIIIDECHLVNPKGGMYKKLIEFLSEAKVLGLTATPYRLHSTGRGSELRFITRTRPKIFDRLIYNSQVSDLKERGYLASMEYFAIDGFSSSKLRVNSTGAGYTDRSVKMYYRQINFDNSLLDVVKRLINAGRKNILVFTQFTDESEYLVQSLGPISRVVSAKTKKKDRENILEGFKAGNIKVVSNVGVLTTGFDFPELECVVLARPTMSLGLYYQMVGRGIRPHPDKKSCWVVDMCENGKRFGPVENLKLVNTGGQKRAIFSGRKQLTNKIMK